MGASESHTGAALAGIMNILSQKTKRRWMLNVISLEKKNSFKKKKNVADASMLS